MTNKNDLEEKVNALLKKIETAELQHEYTQVLQALRQQYQEMKSEIEKLKDENKKSREENKKSSSFLQSQSDSYIENFLDGIVQRRLFENPHLVNNNAFDEMARKGYETKWSIPYKTFLDDSTEAAGIELTEREKKILYGFMGVVNEQVHYPDGHTPTLRKDITEEIQYYVGLLKPVGVSTDSRAIQTPLTSAGNQLKFPKYLWYLGLVSILAAGALGGYKLYRSLQDNSILEVRSRR